jgi:predicted Holliday junction resolvase-like endonuclease
MSKKIENKANQMFEQQREQLRETFQHEAKTEFEKYKAEYELIVQDRIKQERDDALERSRATLKGRIAEQMTPLLPEFIAKYEPSDARFIGNPIDYVIFKNMTKNSNGVDEPIEIVFLEVKTGSSNLTPRENKIKKAIEAQQVSFETLRQNNTSMTTTDQRDPS